jgi:hypothetical protein
VPCASGYLVLRPGSYYSAADLRAPAASSALRSSTVGLMCDGRLSDRLVQTTETRLKDVSRPTECPRQRSKRRMSHRCPPHHVVRQGSTATRSRQLERSEDPAWPAGLVWGLTTTPTQPGPGTGCLRLRAESPLQRWLSPHPLCQVARCSPSTHTAPALPSPAATAFSGASRAGRAARVKEGQTAAPRPGGAAAPGPSRHAWGCARPSAGAPPARAGAAWGYFLTARPPRSLTSRRRGSPSRML